MYSPSYHIAGAIGNHYSEARAAIDTPASETYIPYPDASMSCDALQTGIAKLGEDIALWNARVIHAVNQFFPSQTEINNIKFILANLSGKLTSYQTMLAACLQKQATDPATTTDPGTNPTTGKSSSGLLWLLVAGAGIYIYKKRKGKRNGTK